MTFALILAGLVLVLFTGLPIFAGLTLFGGALLVATQGSLGSVSEVIYGELNRYLLVAIPLFAFMAHVMIRSRIVDDLYSTAYTLTRHLPGGVGIATIAACTVFAAISGSSVATALTIGSVAIPQMIRFGYEPRASMAEALGALRKSVWALSLPVLVLGGMYAGVFTATEAAAAGAVLALVVGVVVYRSIGWREIWDSALDASRTSAMLFMILAGASVLGFALTRMRIPHEIVQLVAAFDMGVTGFLLAMMALLFVLGMFLETIAIILITTPVILPVMAHLQINPVWYGILLTINLELALITPPVGMNLFTIKAITRAPIGDIIRGSLPYVLLISFCLGLVMAWPQLALWLPGTMYK